MDSNPDTQGRRRLGGLSRRAATAATALGLVTGGLAGGFIISNAATNSTSSSTSTSTAAPSTGSSSSGSSSSGAPAAPVNPGVFKPNEDPTHEAGESAAREAQENAGQVPTVP
jgi:hypothetical protein